MISNKEEFYENFKKRAEESFKWFMDYVEKHKYELTIANIHPAQRIDPSMEFQLGRSLTLEIEHLAPDVLEKQRLMLNGEEEE